MQTRFEELVKLNEEYCSASPERKQEIQEELVKMEKLTDKYRELQEWMEAKEATLKGYLANKIDIEQYVKEVYEIKQKILEEARKLGAELEAQNYQGMRELIKERFGV